MDLNNKGFGKLRILLGVVVLVLLIAGGIMVVKKKKAEIASVPLPARALTPVEVVRAEWGEFASTEDFLGVLRPKIASEIAPRITAGIIDVRVREGMHVKKGDVLARLDDREQRDAVNALEARLAAARTAFSTREAIYQRDKKLFDARAISREALDLSTTARDEARAEVVSLEHQLDSARTNLSYTILTAPFDGLVTARLMEPGDMGLPGKTIVAMEAPDAGYYVELKVPQRQVSRFFVGDGVEIFTDFHASAGGGRAGRTAAAVHASISRIHPAVRSGTLGVVEADVEERPFDLPSGSALHVRITTGRHTGFKLPLRALLENVNNASIFTVSDDTVHIMPVNVMYRGPDIAVVRPASGPKPATAITVITAQESALLRLYDGQKVQVSDTSLAGARS